MKILDRLPSSSSRPTGGFVELFGSKYYRITHSENMPTFLMNVASASDLWLYLASNGGLTAGRGNPDHALFPYQTVDRIYDSAGLVGPFTALWVETDNGPTLWKPLSPHPISGDSTTRNLYRSTEGDRVVFEEINEDLGLLFRYGWSTAGEFGLVRQCELVNLRGQEASVRLLDGLRNLQPAGLPARLQDIFSCLADAYKTAERVPGTSLVVYALAAGITDRAVPVEVLRASVAWADGLRDASIVLDDSRVSDFLRGREPVAGASCRGVRTTFALSSSVLLAGHGVERWMIVTDTNLDHRDVARLRCALADGTLPKLTVAAVERTTVRLRSLVGLADGWQTSGDEMAATHHCANVLFNIMRGGIPVPGGRVEARQVREFLQARNRRVAARHARELCDLPAVVSYDHWLEWCKERGDTELERLAFEFLPLTFGRRHGDPSRPWNTFNVRVDDENRRPRLGYEGNWRDIFQNWEALCTSHPRLLRSFIAKFLSASTVDGFNPYRVTAEGIEWEVPHPDSPWAAIGYWGDHQIVYLLRFLEWAERFEPEGMARWLRRDLFSYADVPYRIVDYDVMRRDPKSTIMFDRERHRRIEELVAEEGSDGRLLRALGGNVLQVNLAEKLLLTMFTRLTHFAPGAGIWMNTQRPEWNDANNALAGNGASVVTLCHLRRMLAHWRDVYQAALGEADVHLSQPLAALIKALLAVFEKYRPEAAALVRCDDLRRAVLDRVAAAGSAYREEAYRAMAGERSSVGLGDIGRLVEAALVIVDESIRSNRRPDGLYHAYNLLEFTDEPSALRVHHLDLMLEGQVAVLSSGLLSPSESISVLEALRGSLLYRPSQLSYLLYPDRRLPGFWERNLIPSVATCPVLKEMVKAEEGRLVVQDVDGAIRFHPDLTSESALHSRMDSMLADSRWGAALARDRDRVAAIFDEVFHHRAYTGRSGAMFGYEGLGCVYWHMVAKLLLAVQENVLRARGTRDPGAARLVDLYFEIRSGFGFNKSPAEFGAFPMDPYSHTPGHSGAQQPGMTGQVKEEILTRLGELGVEIDKGRVGFRPFLLRACEFLCAPSVHRGVDVLGAEIEVSLPAGVLAFTLCGVLIIYRISSGPAQITLSRSDGKIERTPGVWLSDSASSLVFDRSGEIDRVTVELGADFRPLQD